MAQNTVYQISHFFYLLTDFTFLRTALDLQKKKKKIEDIVQRIPISPVFPTANLLHWCGTSVITDEPIWVHFY